MWWWCAGPWAHPAQVAAARSTKPGDTYLACEGTPFWRCSTPSNKQTCCSAAGAQFDNALFFFSFLNAARECAETLRFYNCLSGLGEALLRRMSVRSHATPRHAWFPRDASPLTCVPVREKVCACGSSQQRQPPSATAAR